MKKLSDNGLNLTDPVEVRRCLEERFARRRQQKYKQKKRLAIIPSLS